jgi:hypothetical protein
MWLTVFLYEMEKSDQCGLDMEHDKPQSSSVIHFEIQVWQFITWIQGSPDNQTVTKSVKLNMWKNSLLHHARRGAGVAQSRD